MREVQGEMTVEMWNDWLLAHVYANDRRGAFEVLRQMIDSSAKVLGLDSDTHLLPSPIGRTPFALLASRRCRTSPSLLL